MKVSPTCGTLKARWALVSFCVIGCFQASPALAEEGEVCRRARLVLDEPMTNATEAQCQQALDTSEEDKWQLWLDVSSALELTKDMERAVIMLMRFVNAADKRGTRISEKWAGLRGESRAKASKIEAELLKATGRVTLVSQPEGAELTIIGSARPGPADKTPVTRYLAPGTHVVRVVGPGTPEMREVSFPVGVGQDVVVEIDLAPGGRSSVKVDGKPVGREVAVTEVATAPETEPPAEVASDDRPPKALPEFGMDPDGTTFARRDIGLWTRLGTAGISVGAAALATGIVFALQGQGLEDEAACQGELCSVDAPLRALVKADSDSAWGRATAAFVTGGVLLTGGIVAVLLDPHVPHAGGASGDSKPRVTPWIQPDGGGISGLVRF